MSEIQCPRCGCQKAGQAHLLHRTEYTRCNACRIGIELKSKLGKRDVHVVNTYIPDGSTISPKTGRVLDSQRMFFNINLLTWFFSKLRMGAYHRHQRVEGTLKSEK